MTKKILFAILAMSLLIIWGCGDNHQTKVDDSGATTAGVNAVVAANNQFAFELYKNVTDENSNVFFSPYSISTALAMTYEGARGKTAEEMQSVFHFPKEDIARRTSYAKLYTEINSADKKYELKTANALWVKQGFSLLPEFLATDEKYYGAKATNLDFQGKTEESRTTINSWVEDQTNSKIKDLIPKGVIDPKYTRLILTNAIYFKGKWLLQFDKKETREEDFNKIDGISAKAQMMHIYGNKAYFRYMEDDSLQAIEMPYQGENVSMMIILPKEGKFEDVEKAMSSAKFQDISESMRKEKVEVYLPKFKFDSKMFMADTLKQMGMPLAFSVDADFSGMDGEKDLYIGAVIHQAYIDVYEEGTEAAAATAVIMVAKSTSIETKPIVFKADHPFIFLIKENSNGNILFMGRVMDPTK